MSLPRSAWRLLHIISLEMIFVILLGYALLFVPADHPWIIGDWLINYQGGFVRRGLIGEILFQLSSLVGLNLRAGAVFVQLALLFSFITSTCLLAIRSAFTPLNVALIYSPAFIMFPVLNPHGGFRKELLLFALLALVCCLLVDERVGVARWLPPLIGLAGIVIVLSHEMLVVFLPYLLCALVLHARGLSVAVRTTALWLLPSLCVAALIVLSRGGDRELVMAICRSLGASAPRDCAEPGMGVGAITFLEETPASAYAAVLLLNPAPTRVVYAITALLSLAPLALKLRSPELRARLAANRSWLWLALGAGGALVMSLPLFMVVSDYGRIIYIHVVCLSLLALMATPEPSRAPLTLSLRQAGAWLLCLVYLGAWRLVYISATPESAFPLLAMFTS